MNLLLVILGGVLFMVAWTIGWIQGYNSASKFAGDVIDRTYKDIGRRKSEDVWMQSGPW